MRIMVLGASGLIGSAIAARLSADGHAVVAVTRHRYDAGLVRLEQQRFDIAQVRGPEDWRPLLSGIDAVINCAGTLQDGPGESVRGVHATGIAALASACERAGIRRLIHVSAIGADAPERSAFSASKHDGERALMASGLDWVILRPSVVIGRAAYGGSALLRAVAALPLMPVMPGTGPLQLVHLDDVVDTVTVLLRPDAPARRVFDLVGPRAWGFADAARLLRRWQRRPPAPTLPLPRWIARLGYRLGDAVAWLGWRTPVRSMAQQEIVHGGTGDPAPWTTATGIRPRDLEAVLAREPAGVQERWFASLYGVKPIVFASLVMFWIGTGLVSLGPGRASGMALLRQAGLGADVAAAVVIAGALADIAIGLMIAWRSSARLGLLAALAVSLGYAVAGTVLLPRLWADPLAPLLKIVPIGALLLVALAIREDR